MNALVVDDQYEVTQAVIAGVDWRRLSVDRVFPAYSVKEAKWVFEHQSVDILLCDVEMPPSTGFELVDWAQERWPDLITIFLSSHADFEYARKALALGSYDYVLQPAPYEEIEKALERAIGRVGKAQQRRAVRTAAEEGAPQREDEPPKAGINPVEQAKEYIQRHLDQDMRRSDIAGFVHLNPEYLSHLFKRETGASMSDYIIAEKLKIAHFLLEHTDIKVNIVASKVGFANFSYFSQVFKKHTGLSPLEFRALRREVGKEGQG